jgi:hypothetical protein
MLTPELVRSLFDLDVASGKLFWRISRGPHIRKGKEAGSKNGRGRWAVGINGCKCTRGRIVFMMVHGYMPEEVDHINRNRMDDRPSNLRAATVSQNRANRAKWKTKELPKGVFLSTGRSKPFRAMCIHMGRTVLNKRFSTVQEAELAYNQKATEIWGEFAA